MPNAPEVAEYDVWQLWTIELIGKYADCSARHKKLVQAWPK
jgi:hypothetical protein